MPTYSIICNKCKHKFEIQCLICDYNAVFKTIGCPKCNSLDIYRDYIADGPRGFVARNTLGMLAQKNSEKMSNEEKAELNYKHNKYRFENKSELPEGMKRLKSDIPDKYLPVKESSTKKKRKINTRRKK